MASFFVIYLCLESYSAQNTNSSVKSIFFVWLGCICDTVVTDELLCLKNAGTSMNDPNSEKMKKKIKIVVAILDLPVNQHSQSSLISLI